MNRIFSILIAAFTLALAAPASATPPDAMDVSDELFGISETHLYLLRHTDDNLGQYTTSARHVFLVAIDLKTAEEEYWKVSLTVRGEKWDEDGNSVGIVTQRAYRPIESNPYDILGERGARPISAAALRAYPFPKGEITADADSVKVAAEFGPTYTMPRKLAEARITASNRNVSLRIWEPVRMSRAYTTKQAWADRKVPLDGCAFSDVGRIWVSSETPRVQLVRATCADEDETGMTSVIFVLPPVSQPTQP
ncbi:MAG: hypothetical protein ABJP34_04485 [Erythrobacter sp.]